MTGFVFHRRALRQLFALLMVFPLTHSFSLGKPLEMAFPEAGAELIDFDLVLEPAAKPLRFEVGGTDTAYRATVLVPEAGGAAIKLRQSRWSEAESQWKKEEDGELTFWPREGTPDASVVEGQSPRGWSDRPLRGRLWLEAEQVSVWLEGRLILTARLSETGGRLKVEPGEGGRFALRERQVLDMPWRWMPVDLGALVSTPSGERQAAKVDGVPFELRDKGSAVLPLAAAGWPDWKRDPGSFYESYDQGSPFVDDRRQPLVQVPKAEYIAAYVLAYAEEDEALSNRLTLRIGRRAKGAGDRSQVLLRDYMAEIPRRAKKGGDKGAAQSKWQWVRIPLEGALAQRVEGDVIDLEITKEVRLARRAPDPNRFRWRPLGPSSGVHVAAITLERSPVELSVKPLSTGSLFKLPSKAGFSLHLRNVSNRIQNYRIILKAGGQQQEASGEIPIGQSVTPEVKFDALEPGWYPLEIRLVDANGETLLSREWSFGVLPAGERKARTQAPWGTWDNCGATLSHFAPNDPQAVGEVMEMLGLRYGMFNVDHGTRARFEVVKGNSVTVNSRTKDPATTAARYVEARTKDPDLLDELLLFHEDSISANHVTRVPDYFTDRPAYQLDAEETERFSAMWKIIEEAAKSMRAGHPEVKLHLGNGPMPTREEFYRQGFPAKWFDAAGNENPSFSRIPESQPPDTIANNASLWMDRQLLDAYGYGSKEVAQCYETIYPSTNPGNLSYRTQADYFVRNVLHSMAWGVERIRPGAIADMGNSYYHSNWGGVGFMTRRPEFTPKPAAVAMATLTFMLDGAKYEDFIETGSEGAYLMRFRRPDGSAVLPFWVVRGERELRLKIKGAHEVETVSQEGRGETLRLEGGRVHLKASASPQWLLLPKGANVAEVDLGTPYYHDSDPKGIVTRLDPLKTLEQWRIVKERSMLLENYNPLAPRRKGNFVFTPGEEGLEIQAGPCATGKEAMPMYVELEHSGGGILLPGRPAEVGLQVKGNSAWGRLIFELTDAKGQRWTSIGARAAEGGSDWMADWLGRQQADAYTPGEQADWNTDDSWGLSRINFDGWRYLGVPLPGHYPGEGYGWPSNSQWRSDGDGKVHYPLKLTKVTVELQEKVLYLTRYAPPRTPEIVLRELVSVEKVQDGLKTAPGDYVEEAQVTIR